MEAPEEFTASNDNTLMVKGKRAKRQRPFSQSAVAVTSSSSSGGGGGGGGGSGASGVGSGSGNHHLDSSLPSPSTSGEISTTCQEDEDMANCLILLAQGVGRKQREEEEEEERVEKSGGRRFTETAAGKPAGLFFYECKTCNRSFPSFQALGGHRASHKKLKATVEENLPVPTAAPPYEEEEEEEGGGQQTSKISPPLSFQMAAAAAGARSSQINSKSSKVHECSICGSEFSSGQALGGHMRRHRAPPNSQTAVSGGITTAEPPHEEIIGIKPRNVLPLDLNLPAPPEDDHLRDAEFQFKPNKQQQHRLVFSAPALVDCHY